VISHPPVGFQFRECDCPADKDLAVFLFNGSQPGDVGCVHKDFKIKRLVPDIDDEIRAPEMTVALPRCFSRTSTASSMVLGNR